jgi:ATP-dependent helicase/nuclease subunit A
MTMNLPEPTPREAAAAVQLRASDPAVSAFVAASAGTGKTKLLTDRLLRLMLGGADPAGILCLTFTRAAAAEMAVRLQARLGEWARGTDAELDQALGELRLEASAAMRGEARRLLARVLDLPGGMRIETVHAFCQSLLRRFPIEASLSPRFRLAEETRAAAALGAEVEFLLAQPGMAGLIGRVASRMDLRDFRGQVAKLIADPQRLRAAVAADDAPGDDASGDAGLEAALRRLLGATDDPEAARAMLLGGMDAAALAGVAAFDYGQATANNAAATIRGWLGMELGGRAAAWEDWRGVFLTGKGTARQFSFGRNPDPRRIAFREAVAAEAERILELEDAIAAHATASVSAALAGLAAPVAQHYAARKDAMGLLDYADLIARTRELLRDPGAAWVRYKLDGGLDHLLLDEVQDTSPAQWEIADRLTEEFFAGEGARDSRGKGAGGAARTIFAVGDRKQSIFSFQGAEPAEFSRQERRLGELAGEAFRAVALDVSFRSAAPVLALVDAVFAAGEVCDGVVESGTLHHRSARVGEAGRVELWPLVEARPADDPGPWAVAEGNASALGAPQRLAGMLGAWIAAATHPETGEMLASRGRRLRPGDILLLVRRRGVFERALVRDLKARGVPVAGLDRMALVEQPAVADVLVLLDALLLPGDDLAFATFLTSPLGGLDDGDLIALAPGREGTLYAELTARLGENPRWAAAHDFFEALFRRADFLSPHALIARALGPLGGRARLLARLGADAAEPLDELLSTALEHAREEPPSLLGFLEWLRGSTAEIKREPGAGASAVRILTVHGAKGLQAPLVILPDTTGAPPRAPALRWMKDGSRELPVYAPGGALGCEATREAARQAAEKEREERNRLLYVALTRAEDRLAVCGWKGKNSPPADCWYRAVEAGFGRLDAVDETLVGEWAGPARVFASAQAVPPRGAELAVAASVTALPDWAGAAPDWRPRLPPAEDAAAALVPSRPEGAAFGAPPAALSPLAARGEASRGRARGRALHALLQHLPGLDPAEREAAGRRFLGASGQGFDPEDAEAALAEVAAVLAHPALAGAFGGESRAEVPITGRVAGMIVGGVVDRISVGADGVTILDYKTDRRPPATAEAAPVSYLRQMAAYRAVVGAALPGRAVRCVLVWTVGAVVMELPATLLDRYEPGLASTSGLTTLMGEPAA